MSGIFTDPNELTYSRQTTTTKPKNTYRYPHDFITIEETSTTEKKEEKIIFPIEISGYGHYVPENIISNESYDEQFGLETGWIKRVTGIKKRHFVNEDELCSDIAVKAANNLSSDLDLTLSDVDLIIFSSMGGDYSAPPTSCIIQKKLNLPKAKTFDITGSCCSFVQSFQVASLYLTQNIAKKVLLISADVPSRGSNPIDHKTRILFGDAAAATVLTKNDSGTKGVVAQRFGTDGENWDVATILGGATCFPIVKGYDGEDSDKWFRMDGKKLYKLVINTIPNEIDAVLKEANVAISDVKKIICHQVNLRILDSLFKAIGATEDQLENTLSDYGNTTTTSSHLSLVTALQNTEYEEGDYILLVGFGSGFSWGVMLVKL